jgi:hypothetical protein
MLITNARASLQGTHRHTAGDGTACGAVAGIGGVYHQNRHTRAGKTLRQTVLNSIELQKLYPMNLASRYM